MVSEICTDFDDILFEAVVKSGLPTAIINRLLKVRARAWQLISVNINRQRSADISVIVEKLLKLGCADAHLLVVFSVCDGNN